MDEVIKVILLGIVEGITEFLPISSTGHLIVAAEFVQLQDSLTGIFEIFIQIGAVIAVLFYYRSDIMYQVQAAFTKHKSTEEVRQFWLAIVVAFIPAAILGFLLGDMIEELLFNPTVVALALIVGGVAFIVIERYQITQHQDMTMDADTPESDDEQTPNVSLKQALIIGFAQTLALVPGTSRSGMSIIGGMLAGLDRQVATQFSFYLAIPTLGGATVYTLVRNLDRINGSDMLMLVLGAIVSGIVAWVSIAWLLRYISKNTFIPFGYYRIILGIIILSFVAAGIL
ncbi:MAG: undecaprenyl-diphosphate phosphatase [Aggregatilineales bacterium]